MRVSLFPVIATVTAGLIAATPAFAINDVVSQVVRTRDLDLSVPADVERLRSRLARVARAVCWEPGVLGAQASAAYQACRRNALGKANLQADRAIAAATKRNGSNVRAARR